MEDTLPVFQEVEIERNGGGERERERERDISRSPSVEREREREREKRRDRDRDRDRDSERGRDRGRDLDRERERDREREKRREREREREESDPESESDEERRERRRKRKEKKREEKRRKKEKKREKKRRKREREKRGRKRGSGSDSDSDSGSDASSDGAPPTQGALHTFGYTNEANPFGDTNLSQRFVWHKKEQQSMQAGSGRREREREKRRELMGEIEKVKRRREEREIEKQMWEAEKERMQREKENAMFNVLQEREKAWDRNKERVRADIRLRQGRGTACDALCKYLELVERDTEEIMKEEEEKERERGERERKRRERENDDNMEEEEEEEYDEWDLEIPECHEMHRLGTDDELAYIQRDASAHIRALEPYCTPSTDGGMPINPCNNSEDWVTPLALKWREFWSAILLHARHEEKLREGAREIYSRIDEYEKQQQMGLELKREEREMVEKSADVEWIKMKATQNLLGNALRPEIQMEMNQMMEGMDSASLSTLYTDVSEKVREREGDIEYWEGFLSLLRLRRAYIHLRDMYEEMCKRRLYVLEEREKRWPGRREREREIRVGGSGGGQQVESGKADELESLIRKELLSNSAANEDETEAVFDEEIVLDVENTEEYMWSDKYRPRKPKFFNRVRTGFSWNQYNRTHYDYDNPPPKQIFGYKFNIFYPDLIDPTDSPQYFLTPGSNPEECILRFHAGAPYEDIAFKVLNKPWSYDRRHGFKCQFHRGVLQLWFNFRRFRYKR